VSAPFASAMRSASPGRIAFAGVIIAVGIIGLVTGDFAPIWAGVALIPFGIAHFRYIDATASRVTYINKTTG
jgi:hypothetical protein